jgi:ABC-type multidrug transport system fused ATPase/permease subunit
MLAEKPTGKSTVFKLLNRLYDPTEGRILIDGHDIKILKLADLRRCISVLFQDYTHFPLSVCKSRRLRQPSVIWTFCLI